MKKYKVKLKDSKKDNAMLIEAKSETEAMVKYCHSKKICPSLVLRTHSLKAEKEA